MKNSHQSNNTPIVEILGIQINSIRNSEKEETIEKVFNSKKTSLICTPNPEIIMLAQKDQTLKEILNKYSSLNVADGIGLLWAAKFQSLRHPKNKLLKDIVILLQWLITIILIPFFPNYLKKPIYERIAGSDLIWDIARYAAKNKLKIFLLGGASTVAQKAALKLQTDVYDLRIAGTSSLNPEQSSQIIEEVKKSRADIIFVAYGAPKQEKWLFENLKKTGCSLGIGIGGSLDFIVGSQKRAPEIIRKTGLEWLYRLILSPRRIVRQLAIPQFMFQNLLIKLRNKY